MAQSRQRALGYLFMRDLSLSMLMPSLNPRRLPAQGLMLQTLYQALLNRDPLHRKDTPRVSIHITPSDL